MSYTYVWHIQHDKNRTNLAQVIKLVWSKRTCQQLRQVRLASFAHVRGLAPMMSAAPLSLTTKGMSLAVWEWKRNALPWQWWRVKWRAGWIPVGLDTGRQPRQAAAVIKACSVFCFCTHAAKQGISRWPKILIYYTTVKGYKNAVQSIGYAAAYPAMARIPPESATVYSNQWVRHFPPRQLHGGRYSPVGWRCLVSAYHHWKQVPTITKCACPILHLNEFTEGAVTTENCFIHL